MNEALYGGLDIHKESITGCVLDEQGMLAREHTFPPTKKAVESFVTGLSNATTTFAIDACEPMARSIQIIFRS